MVMQIDGVKILISDNAEQVAQNIAKIGKPLGDLATKARSALNVVGKAGVAAAGAAATASAAIVKTNLAAIKELDNLAKVGNTSVAMLQRQGFAAESAGVPLEKYADILKDFNDRIGDFVTTGGGPMADFFNEIGPKIGVTADQFRNLSGPDALQKFVSSLEKANLSQEEMTFHMEAMAGDATLLLPLLKNNGKAMGDMAKMAEELGIGLSQVDVEMANQANQQLNLISATISSKLKEATVAVAPFITDLTTRILDFAKQHGGVTETVVKGMGYIGRAVATMGDGLHGVRVIVEGLHAGVRLLIAGMVGGFVKIIEVANEVKNALIAGMFKPIQATLGLLAKFSDAAAEALESVNNLADATQTKLPEAFQQFADAQFNAAEEVLSGLDKLAQKELPSQKFDAWFENIKQKSADMRSQIQADIDSGVTAGIPGAQAGDDAANPAVKINQDTISIMEALTARWQTQEEAQLQAYEREKAMLDQQLAAKEIMLSDHSEKMADIKRKEEQTKFNIAKSYITDGLQVLASGSKKAQKVMQAAAVIRAVIAGKEAAVNAWNAGMATGGPWAPAVAAAYATASLAKTGSLIQSIKAGGSSQGSAGGGGQAPATAGGSPPSAQGGQGSTGGQSQSRRITLSVVGEGLLSTEQVRGLMDQINDEIAGGATLG